MARSRSIALVLATAIGLIPFVPPEHVHESDEHGHHHVLVHRHGPGQAGAHHSHDHTGVFDDDDGPVVTLAPVFAAPVEPVLTAPVSSAGVVLEPPLAGSVRRGTREVEILIHGPPRAPASLRAPPSSLLL
jgi:hypothetical protein